MKSRTDLQQNNLESSMNDNDRIDTYMNETLQNENGSSGIGLLNIHTLPQDNVSSKLNEMNMSVDNGYVKGDYFYMNSSTGYFIKNHIFIDYANKRDEISTNKHLRNIMGYRML